MKPNCTHIAIHAREIATSVAFYQRYAELIEVHRRSDGSIPVVWLGELGHETRFVIVLLGIDHEDAPQTAPLAHIGYSVDSRDRVDALAGMARAEGILVDGPTDAGPIVGYYCIVRDPDGNLVEFSHGQSLGGE